MVILWDIPGSSTESIETGEFGEEYIAEYSLGYFKVAILTTCTREMEMAKLIFNKIKEFRHEDYDPKVLVVRSKIDQV